MDGLFLTNLSPPAKILSLCFLTELKIMMLYIFINRKQSTAQLLENTMDFWQQLISHSVNRVIKTTQ